MELELLHHCEWLKASDQALMLPATCMIRHCDTSMLSCQTLAPHCVPLQCKAKLCFTRLLLHAMDLQQTQPESLTSAANHGPFPHDTLKLLPKHVMGNGICIKQSRQDASPHNLENPCTCGTA